MAWHKIDIDDIQAVDLLTKMLQELHRELLVLNALTPGMRLHASATGFAWNDEAQNDIVLLRLLKSQPTEEPEQGMPIIAAA